VRLLILEGMALQIVGSHGIPAAPTNVNSKHPDYWFLEASDSIAWGMRGGIAVLSLAAVHDESR